MTAPERFADSQIPLAPRAPSIHDPSLHFAPAMTHAKPTAWIERVDPLAPPRSCGTSTEAMPISTEHRQRLLPGSICLSLETGPSSPLQRCDRSWRLHYQF